MRQIYVLKRSNGFIGIYVNGHKQENLVSNFSSKDWSSILFDTVNNEWLKQCREFGNVCEILFTDDEEPFKSGLPSLEQYLGGLK